MSDRNPGVQIRIHRNFVKALVLKKDIFWSWHREYLRNQKRLTFETCFADDLDPKEHFDALEFIVSLILVSKFEFTETS